MTTGEEEDAVRFPVSVFDARGPAKECYHSHAGLEASESLSESMADESELIWLDAMRWFTASVSMYLRSECANLPSERVDLRAGKSEVQQEAVFLQGVY